MKISTVVALAGFLGASSALANTSGHHFSGGGGGGGSSGGFDDCIRWSDVDAGTDGGDPDAGTSRADAGSSHLGQICVEHANIFGCGSAPGPSTGWMALATAGFLLALARRRL